MAITRRTYTIALLAACVVTRLLTTIYYVEDTDSLRFALSVYDRFDVTALQPHFPGYPVFWAAAKAAYLLTGSFAVAFSLVGGLATFGVVHFGVRLSGREPLSVDGLAIAFVLFFNPMIWLMGNRYMPDLLGLAVGLAALWSLSSLQAFPVKAPPKAASESPEFAAPPHVPLPERRLVAAAGLLTGLLAGTRLSYIPLVLPAFLFALRHRAAPLVSWSVAGVAVWLVPLLIRTGWAPFIGAAGRQTEGHFTEFGGTVEAYPDAVARGLRLIESAWADGFGAWWPGRHGLTLVVAAGLLAVTAVLLVGAGAAARRVVTRRRPVDPQANAGKGATDVRSTSALSTDVPSTARLSIGTLSTGTLPIGALPHGVLPTGLPPSGIRTTGVLMLSAVTYTVWIFLFQNIIYKSRHVLPLVALCAIPIGLGLARLLHTRHAAARVIAALFVLAYAAVTLVLVAQHRQPTAIARVKQHIEEMRPEYVASIPLVNYYLSAQGVQATYLSVQDPADRLRLDAVEGRLVVVGKYAGLMPANPTVAETFYHNPYVNRMWSEVEVSLYDR